MKEERLMTDVGTISSGEDLLGSEEISFLISSDVTECTECAHHWAIMEANSRRGGSAWERVDEIEARTLSIFSLKNDPNWEGWVDNSYLKRSERCVGIHQSC